MLTFNTPWHAKITTMLLFFLIVCLHKIMSKLYHFKWKTNNELHYIVYLFLFLDLFPSSISKLSLAPYIETLAWYQNVIVLIKDRNIDMARDFKPWLLMQICKYSMWSFDMSWILSRAFMETTFIINLLLKCLHVHPVLLDFVGLLN